MDYIKNSSQTSRVARLRTLLPWDCPDPRQGPESPFPGKEGFGVQKLPFPLVLEKEFSVEKIPFFFYKGTHRKWGFFWTENSLFPALVLPENGDSGPSGVGGIPTLATQMHLPPPLSAARKVT